MRINLLLTFIFCGALANPVHSEEAYKSCQEWTNRVYLATYPRSGNHWVRYLLEEVTHIATSSVYCDMDLPGDIDAKVLVRPPLGKPFPWGGYCPKYGYEGKCRYPGPQDVFVVKTHFPAVPLRKFDRLPYIRTLRIVRHPVDSFYSFYVWSKKNDPKITHLSMDFLKKKVKSWKKFHEFWNQQKNVITIRYEDLLFDPDFCLRYILESIGYTASEEDITRALQRFPPKGKPFKHFAEFSQEELIFIQNELRDYLNQFGYCMHE